MKRFELCAALALAALIGVACQGVPEDAATDTAPVDASAAPAEAAAAPAAAEAPRITADQLAEVFAGSDVFLLDVRRPDELEELGTVEGYTNIPIDELAGRLDELPRDRPILTA
jgi:hypothetical protein